MAGVTKRPTMTPGERAWVFVGLVVPLVPLLIAALVGLLQRVLPTYGAAAALLLAAVLSMALLQRPMFTEGRRKIIKAGLDVAWNLWTFITTIVLFTSVAFIQGDKLKLDNLLKLLTSGWITIAFAVIGTAAAARLSVAGAEWMQSLRRRPTPPNPKQIITSGYPYEDEYGYSRAVRVGNQVFVSGTTARPPHLDGDAYEQAKAILSIVGEALGQAGATLQHVVRTVVYVVDMNDAPLVARAHTEAFGQIRPASTLVQVAALTPDTARVEVEATAVIDD